MNQRKLFFFHQLTFHKKKLDYLQYHNFIKITYKFVFAVIKFFDKFVTINNKNELSEIDIEK